MSFALRSMFNKETMKISTLICASLLWAASDVAVGQGYPSRPVRLVVGFTPGGGADTIARVIGARFSERTKQPMIVDNRPGASGMVATSMIARSAPDGYNLLLANSSFATNPVLYSKTAMYDPGRDFDPIYQLGSSQYLLTVNPSLGPRSVKELIALAKARPGKLNAASAGLGGPGHLALELFKMHTGTDIAHVPYKGTSPVLTSLMSGETQMIFGNVGATVPLVQAGKLQGLAVTGASRSPLAPDFPTVAEAGVPRFEVSSWYGVFGPRGTPATIVAFLYKELATITEMRDVRDRLVAAGLEIAGAPPEKFSAYVQSEVVKWSKVVKAAGIRLDDPSK
jgi:tripartite-type tricarboxylate transporter receptor subunit TctC